MPNKCQKCKKKNVVNATCLYNQDLVKACMRRSLHCTLSRAKFTQLRALLTLITPSCPPGIRSSLVSSANRCFFGLRKHLQFSHLSRQTKFTIHKTLIRPVLLYGSEMWVVTKREENQLNRKSKMVSTGEGTTTNSRASLTARMPLMS
jgi:hypothetical protein